MYQVVVQAGLPGSASIRLWYKQVCLGLRVSGCGTSRTAWVCLYHVTLQAGLPGSVYVSGCGKTRSAWVCQYQVVIQSDLPGSACITLWYKQVCLRLALAIQLVVSGLEKDL